MNTIILLKSDASLDFYPNNTSTDFINVFPEDINHGHDYAIALSFISIPNTHRLNHRLIKVVLNELGINSHDSGTKKVLAIIPLINDEKGVLQKELARREYFPLQDGIISSMRITILDEFDNVVDLRANLEPTVIQLSLGKMSRNSFIMRIKSTDENVVELGENNANFTCLLEPPIDFGNSQWKVALLSVLCPNQFNWAMYLDEDYYLTSPNGARSYFTAEDYVTNLETFVDALNLKMQQLFFLAAEDHFEMEADGTLVYIKGDLEAGVNEQYIIGLSRKLFLFLGSAGLDAQALQEQFGNLEVIHFNINRIQERYVFGTPRVAHFFTPLIALHADFIGHGMQAAKYNKIMKIFTGTASNPEDYRFYESSTLEFSPVTNAMLQTMQFKFKTIDDKKIIFNQNYSTVYINLLFSKR